MVAIVLCGVLLGFPEQDSKDGRSGPKVGVVNLRQCFDRDRYERMKEVEADLLKYETDFLEELKATQKKIDGLKLQLEGLKKDMAIYWDKLGQLKLAETELKYKREVGQQQYLSRKTELIIQAHNEIRRVVSIYGKDHGFDLVLRFDEPQLGDDDDPRLAMQRIQSTILYHADALDITNDVIKLLNQEYLKQKAASQQWECPDCKAKNVGGIECSSCKKKKP